MIKLKFIADGGHGWLKVPLALVNKAESEGVKPSHYSYFDAGYGYLEEDCDAPAWDRWAKKSGIHFSVDYINEGSYSPIRRLARFQ